jgi:protein-tyrosine-phosphatase/predicted ATP-grasp superfamily ATP-dependent carboligase
LTQVLVCDGEQRSALAVVRSLGRAGHRVYVCSHRSTALAFGSRYAGGTARVPDPLVSVEPYVAAVGELVGRWGIEMVIPVTDQSSAILLSGIDGLRGARIPGPDAAMYARAADKRVVLAEAAALGIAIPRQVVVGNASEAGRVVAAGLRFPVVIKSTVSVRGGTRHPARYATDEAQLARTLTRQPPDAFPVLVQERIVGPGTGIFLLVWDGETLATFAHRRIRESPPSGGASVCSESIPADPRLVALSRSLLDRFGWRGVAMVEFKIDAATGTPYLMEVNGRFWGSLQLAIDAGVDFPALLVAAAGGRPARAGAYRTGVRLRWWWGDVDHLITRFRAGAAALALPPNARTRWQELAAFLAWRPEQRWEELRLDDPWPFVRASAEWVAGRARGRGQRMVAGLRAMVRALFRLPERSLHPRRQRSTVGRLARWPRPGSVVVLCYGNICRSPYAAAVARRRLPAGIRVGSAGFFGPDRPAPSEAIAVAAERGVDLSPHRSRQMTANIVWSADLILVMEARQRRRMIERFPTIADRVVLLGDLDPQPIGRRDVPDPFGQPVETFQLCFDRIDRCVGALAAVWSGAGVASRLG